MNPRTHALWLGVFLTSLVLFSIGAVIDSWAVIGVGVIGMIVSVGTIAVKSAPDD